MSSSIEPIDANRTSSNEPVQLSLDRRTIARDLQHAALAGSPVQSTESMLPHVKVGEIVNELQRMRTHWRLAFVVDVIGAARLPTKASTSTKMLHPTKEILDHPAPNRSTPRKRRHSQ